MIQGGDIQDLVDLLKSRGAYLYHACQFIDFRSYLDSGGLPSRAYLQLNQYPFTSFQTDTSDHSSGVWDKVFANLSDFGANFARGYGSLPNPYGPILLVVRPEGLLEATDVAICLRSAGGYGFDRERESLRSVADIDSLFVHPVSAGHPHSSIVKFGSVLRLEYPDARDPEISCTIPTGRISTAHIVKCVADPYSLREQYLDAHVRTTVVRVGIPIAVERRACISEERARLYDELASKIEVATPKLAELAADSACSEELRDWAGQVGHLDWQFGRFAQYLRMGAIKPILEAGR